MASRTINALSSKTTIVPLNRTRFPSSLHVPITRRISSTISPYGSPVPPRRPSPYRLLTPTTFLATFAPLHVQGWRLITLNSSERVDRFDVSVHHGDLQDRQLTRVYEFQSGKEGWTSLMNFSQQVLQEAAIQDHHPSIHIAPASDWTRNGSEISLSFDTGYILQVSTHTHTPLPPVGQPKDANKPRPGVSMKDINLAGKLEAMFGSRE